MDLIHVIEDVKKLRTAIEEGEWIESYRIFVELQQHAVDLLTGAKGSNGGKKAKKPDTDQVSELEDEVRETMTAAAVALPDCCKNPPKGKDATGVGAIGDGKILEIILQVLPFILKLFM